NECRNRPSASDDAAYVSRAGRLGQPIPQLNSRPYLLLPQLPDDGVAGLAQHADDVLQAVAVQPLGRRQAVVDLLLQLLQAARVLPKRRGGRGGCVQILLRLGRPAALASLLAQDALDVGEDLLDALGHLLLPGVVGKPAVEQLVIAAR